MRDLKSRWVSSARTRLLRRGSTTSATPPAARQASPPPTPDRPRKSASAAALRGRSDQQQQQQHHPHHPHQSSASMNEADDRPRRLPQSTAASQRTERASPSDLRSVEGARVPLPRPPVDPATELPRLTLEEPTPDLAGVTAAARLADADVRPVQETDLTGAAPVSDPPSPTTTTTTTPTTETFRRQSLSTPSARAVTTLLDPDNRPPSSGPAVDYFSAAPAASSASMPTHRKIWVKRPGASATMVTIREDDLVDDVRDMILKKYANSLGRSFDSPDIALRIVARNQAQRHEERTLGPEEEMRRTLETYYPGGQTVDEALLIDVPQRRTPKPSPRLTHPHHTPYYYHDETSRPVEHGTDYFPPMPVAAPSPAALSTLSLEPRLSHAAHERSISVLNTGQVPPLPSPGGTRRLYHARPRFPRQATSSPTALTAPSVLGGGGGSAAAAAAAVAAASSGGAPAHPSRQTTRPRLDSIESASKHTAPHAAAAAVPPLPTPPVAVAGGDGASSAVAAQHAGVGVTPAAPRALSPRPSRTRSKRPKDKDKDEAGAEADGGSAGLKNGPFASLLETAVPPINVLIVEDNMINLKLLEAFMKRLKVRWATALNGREAVEKWRRGGFHLVLMDIQLPIMSGLEATKEIRRLERVNHIGVFSETPDVDGEEGEGLDGAGGQADGKAVREEDTLGDAGLLFKSPVIIVALTASSLQSDRHEALAAGCNDFLTKPVIFTWLERKVREWGCMQALIDFDGWRKWKDLQNQGGDGGAADAKKKDAKRLAAAARESGKKSKEKEKDKDEDGGPAQAVAVVDGAAGAGGGESEGAGAGAGATEPGASNGVDGESGS